MEATIVALLLMIAVGVWVICVILCRQASSIDGTAGKVMLLLEDVNALGIEFDDMNTELDRQAAQQLEILRVLERCNPAKIYVVAECCDEPHIYTSQDEAIADSQQNGWNVFEGDVQ